MPEIPATRTFLELRSPDQLQPARSADPGVEVRRAEDCPPEVYRRLYAGVGTAHYWIDRLRWTDGTIRAYLADPNVSLWIATVGGEQAGFFELRRHPDDSVEIALFGLLPAFIGRGFGKHLLTEAVERAWELGPKRVWLHTSTLDHRAALANYLRRGFTPFKTERYVMSVP